jgi:hypothetical protein
LIFLQTSGDGIMSQSFHVGADLAQAQRDAGKKMTLQGQKKPQALHLSRAHGCELAMMVKKSSVIGASCQRDGHNAASKASAAVGGQRPSEGRKGTRPQFHSAEFIVALHLPISFREVTTSIRHPTKKSQEGLLP